MQRADDLWLAAFDSNIETIDALQTGTVDTLIVWLLLRRGALNAVQRRIQVKGGAEHDHQ